MAKTKEELMQLKKEYEVLHAKLKELSEEELKEVIGGSGGTRTVVIPLTIPDNMGNSIKLDVYIDGLLESSLSKTVDPIIKSVDFCFKGTTGYSHVTFKANNLPYKEYDINFDDGSYREA